LADEVAHAGAPVALIGARWGVTAPDVLVLRGDAEHDVDRLVGARRASPDLVVLVDDAERLAGLPIEAVLLEIARRVDEDRGIVIAATAALALDSRIGVLATELARAHTGVVLWPAAGSAVLGPGSGGSGNPPRIPGRGVLVSPRGVERIQVATVSRPR
jgi:S-DNA-T family DNA segregation ATPase FtsK/SpoIIIE